MASRGAKATVKVAEKDRGMDALLESLRKDLAGSGVKVGILGTKAGETDGHLTNVDLATIHEFGAPAAHIPERSFIRATLDAEQAGYGEKLGRGLKAILEGRVTPERLLTAVGMLMVADIQKRVRAGVDPPLAPSTLLRKSKKTRPGSTGSPKPLIDTGRMLQAITYEVVLGGKANPGSAGK